MTSLTRDASRSSHDGRFTAVSNKNEISTRLDVGRTPLGWIRPKFAPLASCSFFALLAVRLGGAVGTRMPRTRRESTVRWSVPSRPTDKIFGAAAASGSRPGECLVLCCFAASNKNESDSRRATAAVRHVVAFAPRSRNSRPVVVALSRTRGRLCCAKKHPEVVPKFSSPIPLREVVAPLGADQSDQQNPSDPLCALV
jgi:hypothetical protein